MAETRRTFTREYKDLRPEYQAFRLSLSHWLGQPKAVE